MELIKSEIKYCLFCYLDKYTFTMSWKATLKFLSLMELCIRRQWRMGESRTLAPPPSHIPKYFPARGLVHMQADVLTCVPTFCTRVSNLEGSIRYPAQNDRRATASSRVRILGYQEKVLKASRKELRGNPDKEPGIRITLYFSKLKENREISSKFIEN